jgi:lipoate---protein ligase
LSSALQFLDGSLGSPAADLAGDEALLEACESGTLGTRGILRIWEPAQPYIVLGYANRVRDEVNLEAASAAEVPIYRRCSGGGSVLQNIGCLNYSLILPMSYDPALESITQTNCFIMQRHRDAIGAIIGQRVWIQGYTDLTFGDKKFSGNSQRRKLRWVLFHGTFLLSCDFELMERVLLSPPRQPDYRNKRRHSEFLVCLPCAPEQIRSHLREIWNATSILKGFPEATVRRLVDERYTRGEWNFRW